MDQDLQDLLAHWLGDHDPGESRQAQLLARLRDDGAFRRAFVDELALLGALKAVQSSEPRWLRLEDEIGWSAPQHQDVERLARAVVEQEGRRRRARRLLRGSIAAAVLAFAATALYFAWRPGEALVVAPGTATPEETKFATVIQAENMQWTPGQTLTPTEGQVVAAGRLRFESGHLTLAYFSGASLSVEGPGDVELLAADRVHCHRGKFRARIPRGAEGFTVLGAGYEVVDLGTEFGLNLEPGGKSVVMVFEGEAAVSVVGKDGRSVRGALVEERQAVEVDPGAGHIQEVARPAESFTPLGQFVPAPLDLAAGYADVIRSAKPWGYWRFQTFEKRRMANEIEGRPSLKALGRASIERSPKGESWVRFPPGDPTQALLMDDVWSPPHDKSYAIEMWVQADLPSASGFGQTALAGLIDRDDSKDEKHLAYLELTARGRRSPHEPCAVRFLDRWPPGVSGGADVFSRRTVVPSLWHHVVGQRTGDTVALYIDGERVGTSPAKTDSSGHAGFPTTPCRLLVGRLKQRSTPPFLNEIRAFEGRLAELALYDHALTAEEIRHHAGLRGTGVTP